MATLTNKTLHTATLTNKTFTQAGLLVGDATMTIASAVGFVGTPYSITNKSLNTATVTNKALS